MPPLAADNATISVCVAELADFITFYSNQKWRWIHNFATILGSGNVAITFIIAIFMACVRCWQVEEECVVCQSALNDDNGGTFQDVCGL